MTEVDNNADKNNNANTTVADKITSSASSPIAPKKISTHQANTKQTSTQGLQVGILPVIILSLIFGFGGGFAAISLDKSNGITSANSQQVILHESEVISSVVDSVSPSVVSITVESDGASVYYGRTFTQESAGTGIIISEDGYVLTNKHVIPSNTTALSVILSDGTKYEDVEVVGRDPFNDLAYLKINDASNLTAAKLGDSTEVKVGDKVIAIGNALGEFNNTVTSGIISGVSRPIVAGDGADSSSLQNLFQTDASINPGNSGGPLLNVNGEVIGVNTAVAGNAENIGFSIPINDAKSGVKSVLAEGRLIKPYLGVRYITLSEDIAAALGLDVTQGAYIDIDNAETAVLKGSPAEKAGLKGGDIITKVDGKSIDVDNSLVTLVSRFGVGDTVPLTIVRDGNEKIVDVVLEEVPESLLNND